MLAHPGALSLLQALLTPLVAVVALGIAFAQWWTARNKLKFDLFERRWRIYDATRAALLEIRTGEHLSDAARNAFVAALPAANWLLDDELYRYLRSTVGTRIMIYAEPVRGPELAQREDTKRKKAQWVDAELEIINTKFSRYLTMDEGMLEWLHRRLSVCR